MASKAFYDEGSHVAEIIQQALTEANTGTAQLLLRVKILGTPDGDGSYTPHRNQYERSMYLALTEKTLPFVTESLEAIGYTGNTLSQLDPQHIDCISLVGKQIDLWCKHELYQGNEKERWQISNRREIETKPVSSKGLKNLDLLFGRQKRAGGTFNTQSSAAGTQTAQRHAPAQANEEITDDDIPF